MDGQGTREMEGERVGGRGGWISLRGTTKKNTTCTHFRARMRAKKSQGASYPERRNKHTLSLTFSRGQHPHDVLLRHLFRRGLSQGERSGQVSERGAGENDEHRVEGNDAEGASSVGELRVFGRETEKPELPPGPM